MKALFVFGTRPEIIKCYTTYRALKKRKHMAMVYFTKQHFDKDLLVWDDFKYDKMDLVPGYQPCDVVIVQGDTWSCMEGSIFARRLNIPLAHIEAGIRSFDMRMVEEHIRKLVDFAADYLFSPTKIAEDNLHRELRRDSFMVGNPIYDLLKGQKKKKGVYVLVTLHRPETVDDGMTLADTLEGIDVIARWFNLPVKFMVHPRTVDKIIHYGIYPSDRIEMIRPMPYKYFIEAVKNARLVITDSGGVQEEASILKVPCLTARKSTERPETVKAKHNIICGNNPHTMLVAANDILSTFDSKLYQSIQLYGDGHAGDKIARILEQEICK